ncbi:class I SAM-dependent methyltransferase [Chitinimonas sp. JJ19]|uniref:class I SAM-dependent methyltransferase n=1 Tax=Chitinimonas sp. JJ19 TaxID=3109352 RepID=UPI003002E3ED
METAQHNTSVRFCPDCGQDNTRLAPSEFGSNDWPIKQCSACHFVYLETVPVYERLSEEFAWEKTSVAETERRVSEEPIKQSVSKALKTIRRRWLKRDKLGTLIRRYFQAGKVLDVGCAEGGILKNLDSIYIPHGIEISKALAAQANSAAASRGGYVVHNNALSGLAEFQEMNFTGIVMSAFLEHECEPRGLLSEAFRSLKAGGHCIIKVPNFASLNRVARGKKWCGFRLPDHVNYFTPANLAAMCVGVGFRVEKFSISDRLPTSDNMWIVIQKPL